MKRIVALLLTIFLIVSSLSGCTNGHFRFSNDNTITRGQWINDLSSMFGLDQFNNEKPYFSDISNTEDVFNAVQSCYEWKILRDVSKEFKKDDAATLSFVVSTAVYAIGADISYENGNKDVERALVYAENNGIVPQNSDYNKWVTKEQSQIILSAAQGIYLNQTIKPVDKVELNENVTDIRTSNAITPISDNEFIISNSQPKAGDIIIAPGNRNNPNGIAIKVENVIDNGDGTYRISTTTPELYEVFDEVEYAGVAVPKYEDIVPANGVQISGAGSNLDPVSYRNNEKPSVKRLSFDNNNQMEKPRVSTMELTSDSTPSMSNLGIGDSKDTALSFTASCNFTKGTVSVNPAWSNASANIEQLMTGKGSASPEAGEWFKKTSVIPDKNIFGSDPYGNDEAIEAYKKGVISADELRQALVGTSKTDSDFKKDPSKPYVKSQEGHENIPNMTNKFSGGYEIVGSLSIKDLYVVTEYKLKTAKVFGIDTGIPTGIERFTYETNYSVSASLTVKGKLEEELTVCSIPVSLGGVGTITVELKLYAELNGEISVKATITNNSKTEYSDGNTKKTCNQSSNASAEANLEFEAGPKIEAKLYLLAIPLVDASISAAVKVKSSGSINYSTSFTESEDSFVVNRKTTMNYNLDIFVPIVKFSIGSDKSTLANKLNIKFSWTIVGEEGSNAPLRASEFHLLDKELVIWQETQTLEKHKEEEENNTDQNGEEQKNGNISISTYYINLMVGETTSIDLQYPKGYDAKDFKWTTSDKKVAAVENGKVTAKKNGVAIIKAESKDGKYYANCSVYVGEEGK